MLSGQEWNSSALKDDNSTSTDVAIKCGRWTIIRRQQVLQPRVTVMAMLMVAVILTQPLPTLASNNTCFYHSVGTMNNTIASAFVYYRNVSRTICLGQCTIQGCLLVAWGSTSGSFGDCYLLGHITAPSTTTNVLNITLSVYVPPQPRLLLLLPSLSWAGARDLCSAHGGQLFAPTTVAEVTIVYNKCGVCWTGWSNQFTGGTYITTTGVPMNTTSMWYPPNPDNYAGLEHCAQVAGSVGMNDWQCQYSLSSLCSLGV
nr:uncharacterized protein LOC128702395 [Cherax quadricarinatus]